ncbi:MAG: hypothetical protein M3Z75_12420 [Actinomycetota bacterium]|nr:hypothetical protein [Actinomycetota bacterium]
MAHGRDVAAFEERATDDENGWRGRRHHEIAGPTVDVALTASPRPQREAAGQPAPTHPWTARNAQQS